MKLKIYKALFIGWCVRKMTERGPVYYTCGEGTDFESTVKLAERMLLNQL